MIYGISFDTFRFFFPLIFSKKNLKPNEERHLLWQKLSNNIDMQSAHYYNYSESIEIINDQIEMLDGAHFLHIVAYD